MASAVRRTFCTTESWVFTQWICCLHVKEPYKCKYINWQHFNVSDAPSRKCVVSLMLEFNTKEGLQSNKTL